MQRTPAIASDGTNFQRKRLADESDKPNSRPREAKKKMTIQATVCPSAVIVPRTNKAPLTASSSKPEAT